ncbi:MAG: 50S ribosomal protein L6 [Verrucomicrobia bacterium]|nr:50S ribosomal protein L6 [Verrucomicrobiota bacterium]
MSRIGKQPIVIPAKVKVEVAGDSVQVEGPKGRLQFKLPPHTRLGVAEGRVVVSRDGDEAEARAMHGLCRSVVNNMVKGVTEGFVKRLEIHGVGFKAALTGNILNLSLGYSHPINYTVPPQIKVTVEENTKITVEGPDRQVVGQVAAHIRSFYPPEPYKGKGVRYTDERIIRKEGKTVQ